MRRTFPPVAPGQLAYVFSGKRYLLARLVVQIVLGVAFVVRVNRGAWAVTPLAGAGVALMIAGVAIRRWAMRVMGERFRGYEVRREEQGLETRGPYRIVRHPGYLGLVLMDVGLPLLLGVPWGVLLSAVLVGFIVHRIQLEEALMDEAYTEYAPYAGGRKRLIPGIW